MKPDLFWLMMGALGTWALVVGIVPSILLSLRAERKEREAFRQTERDQFYAELDRTYLEIQRLILQYPHLSDQLRAREGDEKIRYETFAFVMWNFLESIHDYCLKDKILRETWHCILENEARSHSNWFNDPKNRPRFKPRFVEYIEREGYTSPQKKAA